MIVFNKETIPYYALVEARRRNTRLSIIAILLLVLCVGVWVK